VHMICDHMSENRTSAQKKNSPSIILGNAKDGARRVVNLPQYYKKIFLSKATQFTSAWFEENKEWKSR